MMVRTLGVVAYAAFDVVFVYFIGFCMGLGVLRTVDSSGDGSPFFAFAVDLALVAFFGVIHSVMARPWFKKAAARVVPAAAERSLYVLVASLQLALLCWQWRSPGGILWTVTGVGATLLLATSAAGWALSLASSFSIDHFELFGVSQAFGRAPSEPVFRIPFLYRWVRHPLYLGMILGLWAAPVMSVSHLLLAGLFTAYVLIGVRHEERDLVRVFGDEYREYQASVPMLLPFPRRGRRVEEVEVA